MLKKFSLFTVANCKDVQLTLRIRQTLHENKLFRRFVATIARQDHLHNFIGSGLTRYLHAFVGCLKDTRHGISFALL